MKTAITALDLKTLRIEDDLRRIDVHINLLTNELGELFMSRARLMQELEEINQAIGSLQNANV